MALKAEGIWSCTVLGARAGKDGAAPYVQIDVVIDDGPSKGMRATYEDQVNGKSALYVGRSCKAVGWRGGSLTTLEEDCKAWIAKTGGKSTVEIKHIEIKRGKAYDRWVDGGMQGPAPIWDKANSIGRGAARALAPIGGEALADADEALRRALDEDGGSVPDDVPHAASSSAVESDDIPFATCSRAALGEIAKVLR